MKTLALSIGLSLACLASSATAQIVNPAEHGKSVPKASEAFVGERLDGRLQQLAKLTGKRLGFRIG